MNRKGFSALELLVILIFMAVLWGGGSYLYSKYKNGIITEGGSNTAAPAASTASATTTQATTKKATTTSVRTSAPTTIPGWNTYQSAKLGIALQYPAGWSGPSQVTSGAVTIVSDSSAGSYKTVITMGNAAPFDMVVPKGETLLAWVNQNNFGSGLFASSIATTTISKMAAVRLQTQDARGIRNDTVYLLVPSNRAVISLSFIGYLNNPLFNKMLGTVRVLL